VATDGSDGVELALGPSDQTAAACRRANPTMWSKSLILPLIIRAARALRHTPVARQAGRKGHLLLHDLCWAAWPELQGEHEWRERPGGGRR